MTEEDRQRHRRINYRLCTALDLLKLSVILDEMVGAGMPQAEAKLLDKLASTVLALARTANNRLHGEDRVETAH